MAQIDLTAFTFFAPIAAFLIVFLMSFAIFTKTKLFEGNNWLNLFLSFVISTLFISAAGAREYVQTLVPWIAVLILSIVFLMAMLGFIGKAPAFLEKGVGFIALIGLGIIFIVSAFLVFSNLVNYLPGPTFGAGTNPQLTLALAWIYSPPVIGAILLIIISAIVSWVLVKAK